MIMLIIIYLLCVLPLTLGENNCCPIKKVFDGNISMVYNFKEERPAGNPNCMDDCVYTKNGEDYCFSSEPTYTVECIQDKVYVYNLKKAIKHSIMVEIPNQWNNISRADGSNKRLKVLHHYLKVLLQHLTLRPSIMDFLTKLKDWAHRMDTANLTMYRNKVDELNHHNPFGDTSGPYEGCKVYEHQDTPGYSCALWTLFHSLTVSAGHHGHHDVSGNHRNNVANAVDNYIRRFYSCYKCVMNYIQHVADLQFVPNTHDETILWLWAVHNLANDGSAPTHPQWPSLQKSPECHQWNNATSGNIIPYFTWNQVAVLSHIKNVYKLTDEI